MKRAMTVIVTIVIFLGIIGAGGYYAYNKFFGTTEESANSTNAIKTKSKTADATAGVTLNNDGTEWVQVVSTGKVNKKVQDLSTADLVIYRIHNPKILKTVTSLTTAPQSMDTMMAKYPKSLIMNTSGFNMQTYAPIGLQINRGTLISDWSSGSYGRNAFVVNKDGSTKLYSDATSAQTIINNGGEMSFSFGSIVIKNGKTYANDGSLNWKYHNLIGTDLNNNIYLIVTLHAVTYPKVMAQLADLNLQNLIIMDGGGSSQLSYNGDKKWASEDDRSVPDFIVLR